MSYNFETLWNDEGIAVQLNGLLLSNAVALESGVRLNELEVPTHSGQLVISDLGVPLGLIFALPFVMLEAYFTYLLPITINAYDVDDLLVRTVSSAFSNNLGCTAGPPCAGAVGSAPNDHLLVIYTPGIFRVEIVGDPFGSSFTVDDVSVSSQVPEPGLLLYVLSALALLLWKHLTIPGDATVSLKYSQACVRP